MLLRVEKMLALGKEIISKSHYNYRYYILFSFLSVLSLTRALTLDRGSKLKINVVNTKCHTKCYYGWVTYQPRARRFIAIILELLEFPMAPTSADNCVWFYL